MRKAAVLLFSLLFTTLFASLAFASSGHGAKFDFWEFAAGIINFALFIYIIVRFGGPGIKSFYKTRADSQLAAVKEAEELIQKAQALFEQVSLRQKNLDDETQKMIDDAKNHAARQAEELIEAAKEKSLKLVNDAKTSIALEADQTIDGLRGELVKIAVDIAERSVKERIQDKEQKRFVKEFMTRMEDLQQ